MITEKQKLFLTYYLARISFLGIGFSLIFAKTKHLSWFAALLGILIGSLIVVLIQKTLDYKKGQNLNQLLQTTKFKNIFVFLLGLFTIYFLMQILYTITLFISAFFLLKSPPFYILLPFIGLLIYIGTKGIQNIAKVAESMFYLATTIPIIILISLTQYVDFTYLLPITKLIKPSLIYSALEFALFSTIPLIFIYNIQNDGRYLLKMYFFNALGLFLLIFIVITVLGRNIIIFGRFPEYMVLKRIKIYAFIEKIENVISGIWIIDLFISAATAYNFLKELAVNTWQKRITPVILIIISITISFVISQNYGLILKLYRYAPYAFFLSLVIIIFPLYLISKKNKKKMVKSILK